MAATKQNGSRGFARLETACRERGMPVTVQRRIIFGALLERDDHPTVDQLFDQVKDRIPGISRTTVCGLARRKNHSGAFARFDANMEQHHHLVCVLCNKVCDFQHSGLSIGALTPVGAALSYPTIPSIWKDTAQSAERARALSATTAKRSKPRGSALQRN